MKKLSILTSLVLVVVLVISFAPVGSTPAKAKDTLKFWTFNYADDVKPFFQDYVKEWNAAHTDIQVEWQEFPWDQYTGEILTTGIATGNAPDVFFISPGDWRRYADGNLALPLESYLPDYLKQDLLPASLDAVTLNGHVYSIPFEMEPVALWYNKTMLQQAGVQVPTTWDELVAAAKTLTTDKHYGILIPTNPDYYENFVFYPFLWMAGGSVVDKALTKAEVNTPEAARALDLWGTLIKNKYAAPTSTGTDPNDQRFPTGQAAMFVSGYWVYGWITSTYKDFVKDLGVAPIPAPDKNSKLATVYGGWTVMVYANTKYAKQAADFAINMFGAKDNKRAADWGMKYNTKLSPRQSVVKDNADFYKNFPHDVFANQIFPSARPEPAFPPEIAKSVWEAIQDVMFKGVSGKDAVAAWAQKIDAYLKTR
jgi:multiple sugar transport system substrate-binding protein